MSRTACIWIPRFELSARLAAAPELQGEPVILADAGALRAVVLAASRAARTRGVQPRMPLYSACALCPEAVIVPPDPAFVRQQIEAILGVLYRFSPEIGSDRQGAFFLRLAGLDQIHPDEDELAAQLAAALAERGLRAIVALADRPVTAWIAAHGQALALDEEEEEQGAGTAPARARRQVIVPPGADREFVAGLPVDAIPMPEQIAQLCRLLGLQSAGELQRLPAGTLCRRFGRAGVELQQRLAARGQELFAVELPLIVEEELLHLDDPSADVELLLFLHKSVVDRLLRRLAAARQVVVTLELRLTLADSDRRSLLHAIRPARPTLESRVLLDLILLWLQSLELSAPVDAIRARAVDVARASAAQLQLFERQLQQRREALDGALARLRAAFGPQAVVQARLVDRYLPEGRLRWQPLEAGADARRSAAPAAAASAVWPVLRLLAAPLAVTLDDRGRRLRVGDESRWRRIVVQQGPYALQGEWWRQGFAREYLLAVTEEGEACWLFCDARDARWYLHAYLD